MLLNISFSKRSRKFSQVRYIVNKHKTLANFVAVPGWLVSCNTGLKVVFQLAKPASPFHIIRAIDHFMWRASLILRLKQVSASIIVKQSDEHFLRYDGDIQKCFKFKICDPLSVRRCSCTRVKNGEKSRKHSWHYVQPTQSNLYITRTS